MKLALTGIAAGLVLAAGDNSFFQSASLLVTS